MKRLFAIVLALMLCVSLLSVTATAAEASLGLTSASGEAGDTVSVTLYASSASLGGMDVSFTYDSSILELVGFTGGGAGWTVGSHAIWYSGGLYNSAMSGSFTLTFKIKDSAQNGDVATVSASGVGFTWNEDGLTYEEVYAGGNGTVTVACNHAWNAGEITTPATCTENGVKTYTCTKCGETKTEVIPAAHSWKNIWSYNTEKHWHECSVCGAIKDEDIHHMDVIADQIPTEEEDGWLLWGCHECDYEWREVWEYGEEPKVGDIRPMILMTIAGVVATLAAVAFVFKRKNVI